MSEPTETIVLGEKPGNNYNVHLDMLDPLQRFEAQVEDSRHGNPRRGQRAGGSNYAFGDGGARFVRWPHYLTPVNLWLVTPNARRISQTTAP
jgi:hypothetical protein